jgi:malate synthase
MMINALNSGAKVFMADFEDASAPTIQNMLDGQVNMKDYSAGELAFEDTAKGKSYRLNEATALMIVRPRGWHLEEAHVMVDGQAMSASLFDFGLHAFHNAKALTHQGKGPFYYLPKMESYLEARLWDDVFTYVEGALGLPHGTIKATVLIETLPAAFQMDEILHALRHHIVGLNCGRWDYIFSYIKTLREHRQFVLPDRSQVGMDDAFLKAYSTLLIDTCHRRGAHAMGGMAAQIPVKGDEQANASAFEKVRADKQREVEQGHDGTWVAHPDLVPVAMDVFDQEMPDANQITIGENSKSITADMLLTPHQGEITESGIRTNISVGIEYTAAWLRGRGAVPIHNLMEDAATAEISRSQIWQWLRHDCHYRAEDGTLQTFDHGAFEKLLDNEIEKVVQRLGNEAFREARYDVATEVFSECAAGEELPDFLTIPAYEQLRQFPT